MAYYDWIEIGKKNMTCTKRSEKSSGPISVILMLANLLAMLVAISMIYFLPIQVALIVGAVLYGGLLLLEWCAGIRAPVVPLVFTIYLLLIIGYYTTDSNEWLPYTGTVFYAALFTLLAVLLLFKKPFTLFYSDGKGLMSLHYVTAWMWVVIYLMAALASFLLMPDITFIYVPFLLLLVGTIATIVMNFWYFGPFHTRKKDFMLNNFRFSEVDEKKKNELEAFYITVANEFWKSIAKYPKRKISSKNELKHKLIASDAKYQGYITRFIVWADKNPVGTISCYHDPEKGLPIEFELGANFDKLRHIGKVVQLDQFCIISKYCFKQDVFLGLLKCVIELCMEHGVDFLANDAYAHKVELYQKIGFVEADSGPRLAQFDGVPTRSLIMNLSRTIVYEDERSAGAVEQLVPLLNEFVAERSYKRAIIRALFRRRTSRSYEQTDEMLRQYFT